VLIFKLYDAEELIYIFGYIYICLCFLNVLLNLLQKYEQLEQLRRKKVDSKNLVVLKIYYFIQNNINLIIKTIF